MSELSATTVLRRAAGLSLEIDADGSIKANVNGRMVRCGSRTLAVLDAFGTPRTLRDALRHLEPMIPGQQEWIDVTQTVVRLYRSGVLVDDQEPSDAGARESSWASPHAHAPLLGDRERTTSFIAAVQEVVRPGDVVIDAGTGTGLLAVAAARSGASKVFAIEASGIARAAEQVFEANGVADRITLLQGWSSQVSVPEPADVLVTETIGHHPLAEGVLGVVLDARARLLKPGARIVPSRIRLSATPVQIPQEELSRRAISERGLEEWGEWYETDLTPLVPFAKANQLFFARPELFRSWRRLGPPSALATLELSSIETFGIDSEVVLTSEEEGELNGIVLEFELDLSPTITLSPLAGGPGSPSHWRVPAWALGEPLEVRAGDCLHLSWAYRARGKDDGLLVRPV